MATFFPAYNTYPLRPATAPRITVSFRLLREGEVTTGPKFLRFYRGWANIQQPEIVFWAEAGDGEFTQSYSLSLATMLAQGEWLACAVDDAVPRKTRAVYMTLSESGTFTYNITTGEGGGDVGSPATMDAVVKVEGDLAEREVVVIERPLNGQWRLAGYGPTPAGNGVIDVRVTDGSLYAVAVDDWGAVFTPNLAVLAGQVIRPTQYSGWLYRVVEAGTLPGIEPEWWAAEGENPSRPLGTARAVAVRYFRPLAHGPIPVEVS
ncbi:hypothetical protein EA796_06890 [Pseudomonas sp. AOB-7]|uniref:hypothetical protein n=1 Tax=Pseudomonas sp. AOB-7 TaxID=2482750 RepID=UPI000EFCC359|nr:hypothetical protein [Pseudomonas sp. AOB-7]RMH85229.1 hypothetical protein EA796_06890 [Pseudomonas sp. AOB-7]